MNKQTYLALLSPIKEQFAAKPRSFWDAYIDGEVIVLGTQSQEGLPCCVEVSAMWDDRPGEDIRVMLSIDDGGWRAWVPVTDSFIVNEDGTVIR